MDTYLDRYSYKAGTWPGRTIQYYIIPPGHMGIRVTACHVFFFFFFSHYGSSSFSCSLRLVAHHQPWSAHSAARTIRWPLLIWFYIWPFWRLITFLKVNLLLDLTRLNESIFPIVPKFPTFPTSEYNYSEVVQGSSTSPSVRLQQTGPLLMPNSQSKAPRESTTLHMNIG